MMATVKQSSSFSNLVVKETATLTWTIARFDQVVETISSEFSSLNSDQKFQLELNATNELFNANRIFLELWYNGQDKEAFLCYRISILDVNGRKHHTKEYFWKYQELPNYGLCHFNVTSYISFDHCYQLLVNGSLKIYCEVDILGEKPDQFPPQQDIDSFEKLLDNYGTLLESGKLADFVVLIGKKEFRVHKTILAAHSAVFAAMFEHDETKEVKEGRVVIADVEVDVFELLIQYIYTGKVDTLGEYADELFVAADKYQLDHLKSICEQSLISTLTIESVASVLILSDMHNAQQFKSKCIEYIIDN